VRYELGSGFWNVSINKSDNLLGYREKGDHGKATSYVNSFCRSCIPIQLINWVTSQSGIDRKIGRPSVSTPIDLISEFHQLPLHFLLLFFRLLFDREEAFIFFKKVQQAV